MTGHEATGYGSGDEPEFPNQSDRGKCELRLDSNKKFFCERLHGCTGECILYSLPNDNPKAQPRIEEQPATPEKGRYYYCECLVI